MGASSLMMGLTLVLVICLAVVLSLVIVLLAELYCSTLLRRRNHRHTATITTAAVTTNNPSESLTNFYSQSILSAPRSILYPSLAGAGVEKSMENQESKKDSIFRKGYLENNENNENNEDLVYISNPVFDDDENGRRSKAVGNTPFETPETSPSRLETEGSTEGDEEDREEEITSVKVVVETPPLTPMKKLPATVDDGGSGGDLNSNNYDGVSSSSSSETPCTSSLSW